MSKHEKGYTHYLIPPVDRMPSAMIDTRFVFVP